MEDMMNDWGGRTINTCSKFAIGEERLLNVFDENNQGKECFENNLDLFIVTIVKKQTIMQ